LGRLPGSKSYAKNIIREFGGAVVRRKIIIGNWKMNGSLASIKSLCESLHEISKAKKNTDIAVCVPAPYLDYVRQNICGIAIGAQNVSQYDQGAFTGEISVHMLKDFGCEYVLLGHSERRSLFGEDNISVAQKAQKALDHGLVPVVCIGETFEQRLSGDLNNVLSEQLRSFMCQLSLKQLSNIIIAYEPVWAIGTKVAATSAQIQQVHSFIRQTITKTDENLAKNIRIVYGGSLKSSNASEILSLQDVDGGLVGGASLDGREFAAIVNHAH